MNAVPKIPQMLRAGLTLSDQAIGVDRENNVLRGYVVAEVGHFKSQGRGQFISESLDAIVELGNAAPKGLKSRFTHPNMSDDGLGKYLGRSKNYRRDGDKVRADLHFDPTALETPPAGGKPYGQYVMDLAESDPGALGSSLVVKPERFEQPDDEPDVWIPLQLLASDIVDEGDATHGDLLSVEGLECFFAEGSARRIPSKLAIVGTEYLDKLFLDADRAVVESRFNAFRDRYLSRRFGADLTTETEESPVDQETKDALASTNQAVQSLAQGVGELRSLIEEDFKARKEELSQAKKAEKIVHLCKLAGVPERASVYLAEEKSLDDVRDELLALKFKNNAPPADDAAGENGHLSNTTDPNVKFSAEYEEHRRIHEQLGISREKYIARRRKEAGLPPVQSA